MSDFQADSDEDRVVFRHVPPFILPPNAPEAIFLLFVISATLTATLHGVLLTHIVGIFILVLVAKVNMIIFNPHSLGLFARIYCMQDGSETCQQSAHAHFIRAGEQVLAWVSGVAPEEKVLDIQTGAFTDAGQQFQYRAGIIGALATFALAYKIVSAIYVKAYSTAKVSASIAELDIAPASGMSQDDENLARDIASDAEISDRSNPLMNPEGITKQEVAPAAYQNPLRVLSMKESEKNACCTACETLETAQKDWIEAVRQYSAVSETVLEENETLKEQVKKLRLKLTALHEEMKRQDDRIEYLDVLLEEAGKQLGHEADV